MRVQVICLIECVKERDVSFCVSRGEGRVYVVEPWGVWRMIGESGEEGALRSLVGKCEVRH
jgi:hypothetical protein